MSGYNHYADCGCGWCLKYGSSRSGAASVRHTEKDIAAILLREHFVSNRRRAAAFVNPNANCPVCGARVYFYQNSTGSRVFFDDLGGDWPKHPCTDRSPSPGWRARLAERPTDVRSARARTAIATALSRTAGYDPPNSHSNEARLTALIVELWVFSDHRIILAQRFGDQSDHLVGASVEDPEGILDVGDIIGLHRGEVSALNQERLTVVRLQADLFD